MHIMDDNPLDSEIDVNTPLLTLLTSAINDYGGEHIDV